MADIRCSECNKNLGFIEKARLRKGISYLCSTCEAARRLMKEAKPFKTSNLFDDIFKS